MEGDLLGLDLGQAPAAAPPQQQQPPPQQQQQQQQQSAAADFSASFFDTGAPAFTPSLPAATTASPEPAPTESSAPAPTAATSQPSPPTQLQATQTAASSTTTTSPDTGDAASIGTSPAQTTTSQTSGQPGAVWKPVQTPEDEEPATPTLKEIKAKFGGRWKLVRSDPYAEYLKTVGIGILTRQLAARGNPEQHITVKGERIHIEYHSTFHNQLYAFKLDEAVENLVEKSRQSVFCSYREGKLILQMTPVDPGWSKTQEEERDINNMGELVVIHTAGSAVCRRYFAKLPDIVVPLNVVG